MDPREYFRDLHNATVEPIQWIVEDVTPVGLQIVGGAPKSFKSTLTNALPAIVAKWDGTQLPKWAKLAPDMGGPTVMLSGEATANDLAWLYRIGFGLKTSPDTIFVNDDPWDFKLDRQETLNALLAVLDEVNPRLCIIDPLRKYHSGDENDAAFVEGMLYPLRKWAVKNNSAIIVVHHARKESVGQDVDSVMDPSNLRGSNAIFGAADSIIMCRCIDRNIGKLRVAAIHKRAAGWIRDIMLGVPGNTHWSAIGHESMGDIDRNIERLLNQRLSVEQIAKQLRVKPTEVDDVRDKLLRNS